MPPTLLAEIQKRHANKKSGTLERELQVRALCERHHAAKNSLTNAAARRNLPVVRVAEMAATAIPTLKSNYFYEREILQTIAVARV